MLRLQRSRDYRQTRVYRRALRLAAEVHRSVPLLPKDEQVALGGALKRPAYAIPGKLADADTAADAEAAQAQLRSVLGLLREFSVTLSIMRQLGLGEVGRSRPLERQAIWIRHEVAARIESLQAWDQRHTQHQQDERLTASITRRAA